MSASEPHARPPLCFIDSAGGAFAAMAAAFAKAAGRDALAATSGEGAAPAEIAAVLGEIGLAAPAVLHVSRAPRAAERVDVDAWRAKLHQGDGELERLASARIARDKIERRVQALLGGTPGV